LCAAETTLCPPQTSKITGSDFYISTFLSVDCCRWREYDCEELINRDKASLNIFWLRDESQEESDNLSDPDVLGQEIVEEFEAASNKFREIAGELALKRVNLRKGIDYGYAIPAVVSASEEQVWEETLPYKTLGNNG